MGKERQINRKTGDKSKLKHYQYLSDLLRCQFNPAYFGFKSLILYLCAVFNRSMGSDCQQLIGRQSEALQKKIDSYNFKIIYNEFR